MPTKPLTGSVFLLRDGWATEVNGIVQPPRWNSKGAALAGLNLWLSGYRKLEVDQNGPAIRPLGVPTEENDNG